MSVSNKIVFRAIPTTNFVLEADLNIMLSREEKRGGTMVKDSFREQVEDIMQEWEFFDIKPKRCKYTWTNKRK